MKYQFHIGAVLAVLLLALSVLTGCGKNKESAGVEESGRTGEGTVDVDLTVLSSTMVYSEVYNMMTAPENYRGKTVKMTGQFAVYQALDEKGEPLPDQNYYACVIADATACCQQGLEFILADDSLRYPEDYPALGDEITVTGEFQTYWEGENWYCHLINAERLF